MGTHLKKGMLVRIQPKALKGHRPHHGRGILVAVDSKWAWVKPFGRHRQVERLGTHHVKVWKAKAGTST